MAEINGLLNRRTALSCTKGSNPFLTAKFVFKSYKNLQIIDFEGFLFLVFIKFCQKISKCWCVIRSVANLK